MWVRFRRGHRTTLLLRWVNLVVVPRLGSIDSRITHALALWASSMSLAVPAASIPAGDIAQSARRLANLRVVRSEGSIDSRSPERSPFRGFVYVVHYLRPHSRRGHTSVRQIVGNLRVIPREGSIDSLFSRKAHPYGDSSIQLGSRRPYSRRGHCTTRHWVGNLRIVSSRRFD